MAKKKIPMVIWVYRNEPTGEVISAWLKDFDFDAGGGAGFLTATPNRDEAKVFEDVAALHAYYTTQSTVLPLRPDGKPNRPLSGFTIEARPLPLGTGQPWGRSGKTKGHSG